MLGKNMKYAALILAASALPARPAGDDEMHFRHGSIVVDCSSLKVQLKTLP
jgi:hypothetical protein